MNLQIASLAILGYVSIACYAFTSNINPFKLQEVEYHGSDVGEKLHYNSNLYFWFFPSSGDYTRDPVLVWLQGGPGSPSMYGLLIEHGPFGVNKELKLVLREHAWTNNHSVIYIDSPVGTGFSFTEDDTGYARDQTQVGNELYEALQQFFMIFTELRKTDFFVTGD
nr:unnamed protein product [Callosobruchus analis]